MDDLLAVIDLGSNSFRLAVARIASNPAQAQRELVTVSRQQKTVHLAQGLGPDGVLSEEAIGRALQVLALYRKHLEGLAASQVRVVATNTFRVARNAADILARATDTLGFPIEVISGHEEARLIYAGVAHDLPPSGQQRLVIDIGGGSTELIVGHNKTPRLLCSLGIGCGTLTTRFFPDGRVTPERLELAQLAARTQFKRIARPYIAAGWSAAYGSSGTAKGLLAILHEGGLSDSGITLAGLERLKALLIRDKAVIIEHLPGIKPARALVLAGGLAIMLAAFETLHITQMQAGEGALRMGVLCDLLEKSA